MATVSTLSFDEEITPLKEIASAREWELEIVDDARFTIQLPANDGSIFWVYCDCNGYIGLPPAWHWYNRDDRALDQLKDTPKEYGFFHKSGVICAPWNRLAYQSEDPRGPHGDWQIGDWRNNLKTGACKTLAAMALRIAVELMSDTYKGRKG